MKKLLILRLLLSVFSVSINGECLPVSGHVKGMSIRSVVAETQVNLESLDSSICDMLVQVLIASPTEQFDEAAIIELDGGASLTTDRHLKISAGEGKVISKCFKSKNFTDFMREGVTAEGKTYTFLSQEDDKIVQAKKDGSGALTLQASQTAVVIAHVPEGGQQDNVTKAVGVIADYLNSLGV